VGARFYAPVYTSPGAHPASYTMGTGCFPGVKRPGLDVDHPPHLAPKLRKAFFNPVPPHVLVNFVVLAPGHGRSVTDF